MTLRAILLGLLLATACAAPEPESFGAAPAALVAVTVSERVEAPVERLRVDPDAELAEPAARAAARIYAATGATVLVGEGDADLRVHASLASEDAVSPEQRPEGCRRNCQWAGVFSANGAFILINRDAVPEADRERALLHEMLHAVILDHGAHLEPGEPGAMAAVDGIDCMTAADLELVCSHVECAWFVPEACQ